MREAPAPAVGAPAAVAAGLEKPVSAIRAVTCTMQTRPNCAACQVVYHQHMGVGKSGCAVCAVSALSCVQEHITALGEKALQWRNGWVRGRGGW